MIHVKIQLMYQYKKLVLRQLKNLLEGYRTDIRSRYCLETDVREDARKNFKRQPYKSVDVAKYIAKKFGIGGDADGQKDS